MVPSLEDLLSPEQIDNLKALKYELPSSVDSNAAAKADMYSKIFGKQVPQGIVDSQSVPGKSAADSAEIFAKQAGQTPISDAEGAAKYSDIFGKQAAQDLVDSQALPGKSAADSAEILAPKELPAVLGERGMVPSGASPLPTANSVPKSVIEMGDGTFKNLPAIAEESGLPAVIEKAGASEAAPIVGDILSDGLGLVGKGALKAAGPVALASSLYGDLADPKNFKGTPVPGRPGYVFKGPDIVKADSPPSELSLFDRLSNRYGKHEIDLTKKVPGETTDDDEEDDTPVARKPADVKAAERDDRGPERPDPAPINPVIQKYLQDRANMTDAQYAANSNQFLANLARSGGLLANSIAGAKGPIDEAGYKALEQNAQQPVTNLQNAQAHDMGSLKGSIEQMKTESMEASDNPNSAKSLAIQKVYSNAFSQWGLDPSVLKGMSADDINTFGKSPIELAAKYKELQEAAKMRFQLNSQMTSSKREDKQNLNDEKEGVAVAKEINESKASSRSSLGAAALAKVSIDRLKEIVSSPKATGEDMYSVYADMNKVISNTTSMSGTEHQAYNNIQTKIASGISYVTSKPKAPDIPEVKQHILELAESMNKISNSIIARNTSISQAAHSEWIKRHPDRWDGILKAQAGEAAVNQKAGDAQPNSSSATPITREAMLAHPAIQPIGAVKPGTNGKTYKKTAQGWEEQ